MGRRSDPNLLINSSAGNSGKKASGQQMQKSNSMILNPSEINQMEFNPLPDSKEKDTEGHGYLNQNLPRQNSNQSLNLDNEFGSRVSTGSKSKAQNDNSMSQYNFPDDIIDSDEDDEDLEKMQYYEEYVRKMQEMAEETKNIEANMKQFANTIQGLVNNNNSHGPNLVNYA